MIFTVGPPPYPYTREGRINRNDDPYFDAQTSNGNNFGRPTLNGRNFEDKVDESNTGVSISVAGPPGINYFWKN
jgi:hypothetical protein